MFSSGTYSTPLILTARTEPTLSCRLTDPRCMPKRAHATDAGADLFCVADYVVRPGERYLADTGVAIKIPRGYGGFVLNRSSQRLNGITSLGAGLIDSDYRGTIKVLLENLGEQEYKIEQYKTKIGQLVIMPVMLCNFQDFWDDTERGTSGFGSTGV